MKRTILTFIAALLIGLSAQTQELNDIAKYYKVNDVEAYNDVKTFAAQEWKGDHEMMVYVINTQFDALEKIMKLMDKTEFDKEILLDAFQLWSKKIDGKFIYDYEMIVYTYNEQLKSKGAY